MRSLIFTLLLSSSVFAQSTQIQAVQEHHLPASIVAANTDAQTAPLSYSLNQTYSSSSWFDSVDLELSKDRDGDGFFTQLYIRFDAHTSASQQDVYAVYSLINPQGYSRVVYTGSIFTLYGASRSDWFAIDMQINDLPKDYYRLRIQLRDAWSGTLLAEISGADTRSLDNLRLEQYATDVSQTVIVHESAGGSLGILAISGLLLLGVNRRKVMK